MVALPVDERAQRLNIAPYRHIDEQLRIAFVGDKVGRIIAVADQPPDETRRRFGNRVHTVERVHEVGIGGIVAVVNEPTNIDLGELVTAHAKASAISLRELATP